MSEAQYPRKIWDGLGDQAAEVMATQRRVEQLNTTLIQLSRTTPVDFELVAGETINAGQPIYVKQANARAYRARAVFEEASRVCGFSKVGATIGNVFDVTPAGRLELADWTVPLGTGLLSPGVIYYLSDVTGQIMASPPITGFIVQVGIAVTPTILDVDIKQRVRL